MDSTLEQKARQILDIFVRHYNCRAGYLLNQKTVTIMWEVRDEDPAEFDDALDCATDLGWIEIFPGPKGYLRLTTEGFDAAKEQWLGVARRKPKDRNTGVW